jgi:hypothetical protein
MPVVLGNELRQRKEIAVFLRKLKIIMGERDKGSDRPRVLVLGASGLNGGAIVAQLGEMGGVEVVRGACDPRTLASWKDEGKAAVLIDLDDPLSFPAALQGIDRLFLITGYTIHMVHQMKTITDAAVDAGVSFIVHLGVFGNGSLDRSAFRLARARRTLHRGKRRGLVSPPSACLHGKSADGHASRGWRVALANGRQARGLGRQRRYRRCCR